MRALTLTGQRFGRLTVTHRAPNTQGTASAWVCLCDCGTTKTILGTNLRRGTTKSCGCLRGERADDLTGTRFGRLTVVARGPNSKNGQARWLCVCDCGADKKKPVCGSDLKSGKVISCGCYSKEMASERHKDLAGQRFGKLTVLAHVGVNKRGLYVWQCQCDCGGSTTAHVNALTQGMKTSCGCKRSESRQKRVPNLVGQRLGLWTVLERASPGDKGSTYWLCSCDCGTTAARVSAQSLLAGTSRSCGCTSRCSRGVVRDHTGERFGRLIVVCRAPSNTHGQTRWECKCDCGSKKTVLQSSLLKGETRSCGCLANELTSKRSSQRTLERRGVPRQWIYEGNGRTILMRSSWEVIFARWLNGYGELWEYEPRVFTLAPAVRYVPDFYLPERGIWVEVKGRLVAGASKKIDLFRSRHLLVFVGKRFILQITGARNLQQVSNMVERVR